MPRAASFGPLSERSELIFQFQYWLQPVAGVTYYPLLFFTDHHVILDLLAIESWHNRQQARFFVEGNAAVKD
jgi:hypothetical protein